MAIKPKDTYPGRTDTTDIGYPDGKARDLIGGDPLTGTPCQADWVNDDWGFKQALLASESIVASGAPDQVGASQYLEAMDKRYKKDGAIVSIPLADAISNPNAVLGDKVRIEERGNHPFEYTVLDTPDGYGKISATGSGLQLTAITTDYAYSSQFGAVADGVTEDNAPIQAAMEASLNVIIEEGIHLINPSTGLNLRNGQKLIGKGQQSTILLAVYNVGGSVIKRNFNFSGPNEYVQDCEVRDIAVMLNHELTNTFPFTQVQIGINYRNITRSVIDNCYTGNFRYGGAELLYPNPASKPQNLRGYGISLGNVSGSDPAYAGGEVNIVQNCKAWQLRKGITLDDEDLTGGVSAAYASKILNCDVQSVEVGINQGSRFNTGLAFLDNTIQDIQQAAGSSNPTYCYYVGGYENRIAGGYIETNAANLSRGILLASTANRNVIDPFYHEIPDSQFIQINADDVDGVNVIKYFSFDTKAYLEFHNNNQIFPAPVKSRFVKFHWDGAAFQVTGGDLAIVSGISRTGAGDYEVTFSEAYPNDEYSVSVALDTNASGNAGMYDVFSHGSTNIRLITYTQVAGVTTQIDPRNVWLTVTI